RGKLWHGDTERHRELRDSLCPCAPVVHLTFERLLPKFTIHTLFIMMSRIIIAFYFILTSLSSFAQRKSIDQRVDSVLKLMTLDEKIGQMNQYSGVWEHTGPITEEGNMLQQIKEGKLGS